MFVCLMGPARAKAGWFAALLYLFCVLAPGAALALGDAALCLTVEPAAVAHMHADSGQHDHAKHQHGGQDSPNPCCAMLCLSAIAADLPAVAKPSQPVSTCVSENSWRPPGEAPPLHYRPPIA